jgi:hypothetical protein
MESIFWRRSEAKLVALIRLTIARNERDFMGKKVSTLYGGDLRVVWAGYYLRGFCEWWDKTISN